MGKTKRRLNAIESRLDNLDRYALSTKSNLRLDALERVHGNMVPKAQTNEPDVELPEIYVVIRGDTLQADGGSPCPWSIYSENIDGTGETRVVVNGSTVATVCIKPLFNESLTDAVQAVGSAIVWSGIRAFLRDRDKGAP